MQISNTLLRYLYIPSIMAKMKRMDHTDHTKYLQVCGVTRILLHASRYVKWQNYFENQYGNFLKT